MGVACLGGTTFARAWLEAQRMNRGYCAGIYTRVLPPGVGVQDLPTGLSLAGVVVGQAEPGHGQLALLLTAEASLQGVEASQH